jgi:hypothetical protein
MSRKALAASDGWHCRERRSFPKCCVIIYFLPASPNILFSHHLSHPQPQPPPQSASSSFALLHLIPDCSLISMLWLLVHRLIHTTDPEHILRTAPESNFQRYSTYCTSALVSVLASRRHYPHMSRDNKSSSSTNSFASSIHKTQLLGTCHSRWQAYLGHHHDSTNLRHEAVTGTSFLTGLSAQRIEPFCCMCTSILTDLEGVGGLVETSDALKQLPQCRHVMSEYAGHDMDK